MILFRDDLTAYQPLFTVEKLGNPDFPIPISIIIGENDWVIEIIKNSGEKCVKLS